ncbi:wybutosine biosynthesis protein Tyw1 [Phakopsora pachyrhizi]|nr:wybutosine biosynthesis protein Tyw1 [Phakopsora pachyrhizi]
MPGGFDFEGGESGKVESEDDGLVGGDDNHQPIQIFVLYCSLSSTTKKLANQLYSSLRSRLISSSFIVSLHCLDEYDIDQLILSAPSDSFRTMAIFLLPSYNIESPVDSVLSQFRDAVNDFRLSKDVLSGLAFSVVGFGHRDYGKDFCKEAAELNTMVDRLGARRLFKLTSIDVSIDPESELDRYFNDLIKTFSDSSTGTFIESLDQLEVFKSSIWDWEEDQEEERETEGEDNESDFSMGDEDCSDDKKLSKIEIARRRSSKKSQIDKKKSLRKKNHHKDEGEDIEDLGVGVAQLSVSPEEGDQKELKEMISPLTRKSLTKQGYAIIGSHSAVKTCRWTKASLRGRGFCYKHAFYGIQSHQCMEATPSLACANKCTFCWRAHTNPVGTNWRWKTDEAEFVVNESLKEHDRLIKQLAGMPGVREDRFKEARTPRHAALSLVGEPVMFPHIKKYISLLTEKRISTFLVTNAQFPDSLRDLPPVTQLYLSIDAGTKESLRSIDRPLHRDFWERFLESIDILRSKRIRTVFRLTLVKGENCEEIKDYANLIRRGRPDFIEVKGVTFCGYPGSSNLTIKNSPWHNEVVKFVESLCEELNSEDGEEDWLGYGIAAEHAHSCCVLAASNKYLINDQWHTWIDYDRFFELVEAKKGEGFDGLDYCKATPEFSLFGSKAAGFSPEDQRWFRKSSKKKNDNEDE